MKDSFVLAKENEIYIYGAGERGRELFHNLSDYGYKVKAFVDRKLHGEVIEGVQVTDFETFVTTKNYDAIVILTLNNGFEHEKVAKRLFEKGYRKVIFLPMNMAISEEDKHEIRRAYRRIMAGEFETGKIPIATRENDKYVVIDYTAKSVTIRYPIDQIFLSGEESFTRLDDVKHPKELDRLFYDRRAIDVDTYIELFEYLKNHEKYPVDYLKWQGCGIERDENELLQHLENLYTLYLKEFSNRTSFFDDSPCKVIWNIKKYRVELLDGLHRLMFLHLNGVQNVTINLSTQDYEKLLKNGD